MAEERKLPTRTECEKALKALGLPSRLAKRVLAIGYSAAVKQDDSSNEVINLLKQSLNLLRSGP